VALCIDPALVAARLLLTGVPELSATSIDVTCDPDCVMSTKSSVTGATSTVIPVSAFAIALALVQNVVSDKSEGSRLIVLAASVSVVV
jgi:hypothetical protein